ncbi:hypothetical protein [Mucilaginibacter aquariorum]|uniref:Uncharacterized protein n=1 Tax=Mucilaginibacter aquariorum TaxID=2967225 RepID=A0ABT1SZ83_9SPHI|nr:hypothetical protein [Mucilaginibacter aquariorum]MCQ6957661.1 hypothetical protein [Mucilaginibacter aquariorum]
MKPTDELTGMLVLVHPELTQDPANNQGKIGIITGAELEQDDVYVSFGKGEQALYSTDALLVFKPEKDLYTTIMTDAREAGPEVFKTLFQINLMQQHGTTSVMKKAMEMVADNKILRDLSMDTLENRLANQLQQQQDQSFSR